LYFNLFSYVYVAAWLGRFLPVCDIDCWWYKADIDWTGEVWRPAWQHQCWMYVSALLLVLRLLHVLSLCFCILARHYLVQSVF